MDNELRILHRQIVLGLGIKNSSSFPSMQFVQQLARTLQCSVFAVLSSCLQSWNKGERWVSLAFLLCRNGVGLPLPYLYLGFLRKFTDEASFSLLKRWCFVTLG